MVFNATFNNTSVILLRSVLFVEKVTDKLLSTKVVPSTPLLRWIPTHNNSGDSH